mgnify:CR=1 FL=1
MIEEIKNIKKDKKELRSFGITIGIILFIISAILFYYDKSSYQIISYVGSGFIALGIIIPILLKPIYILWMTFAVMLGWVMTRVILSIVFFFIITPISFLTKLLDEDFLVLKKSNSESYWNYRDRKVELNQDYEKQF